jgi:archaellum biogenesis ATPase FlaH
MGNETSQVSGQGEIGIGGDGNRSSSANTMNSIRLMDEQIRQRVRHGIQYNLRMIIRGAKRSGKTMLWKRLQGFKFEEKVCSSNFPLELTMFPALSSSTACSMKKQEKSK